MLIILTVIGGNIKDNSVIGRNILNITIISSGITALSHLDAASALLESGGLESEKFFTSVFPVEQYELAYRRALDSKDSIKTVLSWL